MVGAYSGGLLSNRLDTTDRSFGVLGTKAFFDGEDASGHLNLWVTDGTSSGTSELTPTGAYSGGLFANVTNPGFTVLGSNLLFVGEDVSGRDNLWVTDGTSAGTSELATVGASGLFNSIIDANFTVLGGQALFEGYDAGGKINLWITDGTFAGTSEVIVAGAYSGGLFAAGDNVPERDITRFGSNALIMGEDATGKINLWITDGTAAGTSELAVVGASSSGLNPGFITVLTSSLPLNSDFNGDGKSDFLFQNNNGEADIWELNGTSLIGGGSLGNPGPSWHVRATGDFNGDGCADILWQNDDGSVAVWEMNGTSLIGSGIVGNPGPSWQRSAPAISTATDTPTSCGRTPPARVAHLGDERHQRDRQRQSRQSRAGLACHRVGRFQRRRVFRHPVAEQQRRGGRLGIERDQHHRQRQSRQSRVRAGMRSAPATSTATAFRHSVAERQRRGRGLGIERHHRYRQRQSRQSGAELAR